MTMHRLDVSRPSGVPATGQPYPTRAITRASASDAAVCEWAIDIDPGSAASISADPATSVACSGFVDFDAIESVRASSVPASRC